MGGYGSTRWSWHSKKDTVEYCTVLDLNDLIRKKLITPDGCQTGSLVWRNGGTGEERASIRYTANLADPLDGELWLRYRLRRSGDDLNYRIPMESTKPNYGGLRWWFLCPLLINGHSCHRRASKLYLPSSGRHFGCRHCHKLSYRSSQEHDKRVDLYHKNPEALRQLLDNVESASISELALALKVLYP